MRKPTIHDVKHSGALGPYYFSRETMRFFNQTMRDFRTDWHDKERGILRIFARGSIGFDVKGVSERFIDVSKLPWKEVSKRDLDQLESEVEE